MPLSYGVYDYIQRRNINLFSILGFANVGLTGVIGILELDGIWVAVKSQLTGDFLYSRSGELKDSEAAHQDDFL